VAGEYFEDPNFQDELVRFLVHDRNFLRDYSAMLDPDDFLPKDKIEKKERYYVAKTALEFWRLYREPVQKLLRSEMLHMAEVEKLGVDQLGRLNLYVGRMLNSSALKAGTVLGQKILQYKKERAKAAAISQMFELSSKGLLTDEAWIKMCQDGLSLYKSKFRMTDYWQELDARIARRAIQNQRQRFPYLLIEPFDQMVHAIGRGHIGLAMAPWKRGKSLFLQWVAFAYVIQGLRVAYWTLEDPMDDVEDRFDACVTCLPVKELHESEEKVRRRFAWVRKSIRSKLKIYDGTDGKVPIRKIEDVHEREANAGFHSDVTIVDYDDEVKPPDSKKEKHEQQADIYSEYRAYLGRTQQFGWIASQTGRDTQNLKIIAGSKIADAIGKVRKAHMVLGLGVGDWGEESIYMYVDAHRSDASRRGCNIMTNKNQMAFYDRDATMAKLLKMDTSQEDV
jgi:hypothetical protein